MEEMRESPCIPREHVGLKKTEKTLGFTPQADPWHRDRL